MRLLILFVVVFYSSVCGAQLAQLKVTVLPSVAGKPTSFYLSPFDTTLIVDSNGYSPNIPAKYLVSDSGMYVRPNTTKVVWEFGDGSPEKSIDERVGIQHVYKNPGSYTVKVKLIDGDKKVFQNASTSFVIQPNPPRVAYSAVALDPIESNRLTFTSASFDRDLYKDEELHYQWSFGDGSTREGPNLDQVTHTYVVGGEYKTTLKVTSEFGEENRRKTVRVVAANSEKVAQTDDTLDKPDAIADEVNLQIGGAVSGQLKASAQKLVGATFVAPAKNGDCRLWINFWDDTQLSHGSILLNLGVLPGDISNFSFSGENRFDMSFFADAEQYSFRKKSFMAAKTAPSFGGAMHGYDSEAFFRMSSGSIKLTLKNGDYAVGSINAGLRGHLRSSKKEDRKKMLINANGDFSINIASHGLGRDLLSKGFLCAEQAFIETKRYPEAGEKHVGQNRPIMRVNFSDDLDPDSVTQDSLQVGYPDADGNFIRTGGRFIKDPSRIQFVPDKSLRKGVRYTMKLKVGEQGVQSIGGGFITDTDGTGWKESVFWTQLPFSDDASNASNLSCDVYQSVKNVPLIAGKAALMKVHANWPEYDDVHQSAQYKNFEALIKLSENTSQPLGAQVHTFTRPDLRKDWSKAKLREHEAAQYPFIPTANTPHLFVQMEVKRDNSKSDKSYYYFYCGTPSWEIAPELKVDVFAMNYGGYGYDEQAKEHQEISKAQALPILKNIVKEAKIYAEQLYPVKTLSFSEPVFVDVPKPSDLSLECDFACWMTTFSRYVGAANFCDPTLKDMTIGAMSTYATHWKNYLESLQAKSDADFIVLLGPHDILLGGGSTIKAIDKGQGLFFITAGGQKENFDRYVFGLVHEIGHALKLDHTPVIDACSREELMAGRLTGETQKYEALDGIRQSVDGVNWWHKSTRLGNQESKHLMPLMYPGTVNQDYAFILRNDYRSIQVLLEDLK